MIFVDTGVWYAFGLPTDPRHDVAFRLLYDANEPLVTSDYVVDETLTLLRGRVRGDIPVRVGRRLFEERFARIHYLDRQDIIQGWDIFRRFHDKDWSFTDCTSYVVMQRLNIKTAFSFDHHFKQFNTVAVVP